VSQASAQEAEIAQTTPALIASAPEVPKLQPLSNIQPFINGDITTIVNDTVSSIDEWNRAVYDNLYSDENSKSVPVSDPKEAYSTKPINNLDQSITTHYLAEINVSSNLYNSATCTLMITPYNLKDRTVEPKIQINSRVGDIVAVTMNDDNSNVTVNTPSLFFGFISSIQNSYNDGGHYIAITVSSFLSRLSQYSYLATLKQYGVTPPATPNRITTEVIQQIKTGNYLQHVPIKHDLKGTQYFSMINIDDTQGDVLQKLSSQLSRLVFQRRNGDVYITQLYNNEIKDTFNTVDWKAIQAAAISVYYNEDFSTIPHVLSLTYANSPIFTNQLAGVTGRLKDQPNNEFTCVKTQTLNFPTTSNLTTLFASINPQNVESNVVDIDIKRAWLPPVSGGTTLPKTFDTYMKLQLLQQYYQYLPQTKIYTITLPFIKAFNFLDVGDIINIPDSDTSLWVVSDLQISFSQSVLTIQLIPLNHTTPILTFN
jgi:hypothetical protein